MFIKARSVFKIEVVRLLYLLKEKKSTFQGLEILSNTKLYLDNL